MEEFSQILGRLEIEPQNLALYQTAFTHRSFLNESKQPMQSNERLEFLGDSVLSFIISSFLYKTRPQDTEGDMTNLRAYIVKTESLAKAARELNLGMFLKMSRGEELSGGRENPQLLANTFESILGAVYLDLGIEKATQFVTLVLLPLFASEVEKGAPRDPKSELQEVVQGRFQTSPRYKILSTSGPDHAKTFVVGVFVDGKQIGEGTGSSKQHAEEEAAKKALTSLE